MASRGGTSIHNAGHNVASWVHTPNTLTPRLVESIVYRSMEIFMFPLLYGVENGISTQMYPDSFDIILHPLF